MGEREQVSGSSVAVLLIGAPGSGKSTLAAALLGTAPTAPGPWRLAHGALVVDGTRVSLLDPPGSPELAGELHAGVRAASAVLLVVSPVQGVDPRTVALWDALEHLPRLVVLTQLDRPGADADEAVAVCRRVLGDDVVPLQLPLHDDDGSVGGVLDLLHLQVTEGGVRRAAEPEHVTLVEALREELVEAVLTGSDDQALFEDHLAGIDPSPAALDRELAAAVTRGDVQPVLVASPRRGVGLAGLLGLLARALPAAADQPGPAVTAPDGAPVEVTPVAEAVRTGLVRVWSGSLSPGDALLTDGEPAVWDGPPAAAGDVVEAACAVRPRAALAREPVLLAPWDAPDAQFPVGAPDDAGLVGRVADDPVARLAVDDRTGQLLLWTYGPEHAEALLAGLTSAPVRVPPGTRPVAVRVRVPDWAERAVRSDLAARGGSVEAVDTDEAGVVLDARLPPAEAVGYALALARASASTGTFTRG